MPSWSRGLWTTIAELSLGDLRSSFLNRSSSRCWSEEFTRSLGCWTEDLKGSDWKLDWILSCCKGSDDPHCWSGQKRSVEDCCFAFLPQVLGKGFADMLSKEVFRHLQMRAADLHLVRRLYWSCLDFFPEKLQEELSAQMSTWQSVRAVMTQSMAPLSGRRQDLTGSLKLVTNNILMQQRSKASFVQRVGLQQDCIIDLFSARCEKEHLPIFQQFGVVQGPNNQGEVYDFLGVTTATDVHCPAGSVRSLHSTLHACRPLSHFFECTALVKNWGRLLPMLDEEYFEWEDVMDTAFLAAQRGDHFAMAEATCDVLIVEPLLLDRQLLQEHADRNLPPNRCRVIVVEAFVVQPKELWQLLSNHSRSGLWDLVDIDTDEAELGMLRGLAEHLPKRVRRLHVSTHTRFIHGNVKSWLQAAGWTFATDFAPYSLGRHEKIGHFVNCDGRLSARPAFAKRRAQNTGVSRMSLKH
ncbi:unnamed protein product [Durusdinium trenchii]|uniref:Uncharacterized protein n=1 Tax=Durusdinium trenchii TaxID=1381693 RepID=A0ABP0N6V7_9DINO